MLRIAVPNKGMLSEPAWTMLSEAGYRLRSNPRQLVVEDPDRTIQMDRLGFDALLHEIVVYELVERCRHALALDVGELTDIRVLGRSEPERRGAEPQVHHLFGVGARVQQQVVAGDADIDGAASHIHGARKSSKRPVRPGSPPNTKARTAPRKR